VEELIRYKMHEALDVEQPDSRLRSRVLISLPADEVRDRRIGTPSFQWAGGLVAALLAVAVVAGLLSSRGAPNVPGSTATIKEGSATIAELPIPVDSRIVSNHSGVIAVGPDGNLFIGTGGYIIKVSQSGSFTKYAIPTPDNVVTGFGPVEGGITSGPDGNIWFTERVELATGTGLHAKTAIVGKVVKMTTSGSFTEYAVPIGFSSSPEAITAGPDGNLWFTEPNKSMVAKMTTSGSVTEYTIPNTIANGYSPLGPITAGPDGNIWFTDTTGSCDPYRCPTAVKVAKMTTSGEITEFSLPSAGYVPSGIAAGPDGNLWVTEAPSGQPATNAKVARLTPSGSFTEYLIPNANSYPRRITAGDDGNLWFSDVNGVARITTAGALTEYAVNAGPIGLQIATGGSLTNFFVWFIDVSSWQIGLLTPAHDAQCASCFP
jgi:virginiamycin B lyase